MLFLSCSIRRNAPLPFLALASHEPFMEFGGALSMVDGLAVAGGTGSSEGGSLLSRSLTTSSGTTEPCCKPKGLLGCAFQRASEAMVPPFDSLFPDGEQMLSFSATSKQDSFVLSCDGALPSYYPSPPSPSPKPYLWNPGNLDHLLLVRSPPLLLIFHCCCSSLSDLPLLLLLQGCILGVMMWVAMVFWQRGKGHLLHLSGWS